MSTQLRPTLPPRNRVILSLAFCSFLFIVLIVIGGVSAFRLGSIRVKQADVGAGQFLVALEKSDDQTAFNLLSLQARNGKTVQTLRDDMGTMAKRYGHPVSHRRQPGFYMNTINGVTSVRLVYQETFEKGGMVVTISMSSEGGKWRVLGFNFQP